MIGSGWYGDRFLEFLTSLQFSLEKNFKIIKSSCKCKIHKSPSKPHPSVPQLHSGVALSCRWNSVPVDPTAFPPPSSLWWQAAEVMVRQQTNELELDLRRLPWLSHGKSCIEKQTPLLPVKGAAQSLNSTALAEAALGLPNACSSPMSKESDLLRILKCKSSHPHCCKGTGQTPCSLFIKQIYSANALYV